MGGGETMIVALGIGCQKSCPAEAIESAIHGALAAAQAHGTIRGIFTIDGKAGESGLIEASRKLGLPIVPLGRTALAARANDIITHSPRVEHLFGVGSVAEAAALVGAGPASRLAGPRITHLGAACAVAISPEIPS